MDSSPSEPGLKAEAAASGGGGGGEGEGEASMTETNNYQLMIDRGLKKAKKERGCTAKDRISKMPPCVAGKRSSIYRGVTRHRWTGRYEAHLWDKSTWNQNQNKKGKQVYLGAYDDEEAAARAYDLAALKYWGPGTLINFPVNDYLRDLEEMQNISREDYLASLRRKSSGFSRGVSKYRALSRPSQSSPWETPFGRMGVPAYLSSIHYGTCEGTSADSEYPGGFCIERKIDLTNYIKWWGPNKTRGTESLMKSLEEPRRGATEDITCELKALESSVQQTEPYKMPCLGLPPGDKQHRGSAISAMAILSRSGAYKSLRDKVSKEQEKRNQNNEKNNQEMDCGKSMQKSIGEESERHGISLNMNWLPFPRTLCPLTSFLSAPLMTSGNAMDPLDPNFWRSLESVPPTGPALISEVTKTETSPTYPCFHQEEQ